MTVITLLTDFGTADYYVAAVKGVLLAAAAGVTLVDLSHEVPPGDVEAGSFLLSAAVRTYPEGTIHLAVVDPGVGTARRLLAVETPAAPPWPRQRFVAPDNGLLTPFFDDAHVVAVERPDLYRDAPSATFHGRDRFAPIAATLARGEALDRLGPTIADPVRLELPAPRRDAGGLEGRIAHVDRYGNLVTDLPGDWLAGDAEVILDGVARTVRRVATYGELSTGTAGVLVGSLGTLELSLRGESLATAWGVARGARLRLRARPSP